MQCEILSVEEFKKCNHPNSTFYVGFLQAKNGTWFPFCVSSSRNNSRLDTICVSPNYAWLDEVIKPYLDHLPSIKTHLVHLVYREEIDNLISMYGIEYVGYVTGDEKSLCDCGCGCNS
ncbi:MAG: hypothetical protein N2260_07560 [Syntrophobacterales bacterium]|nr:hypothetical protein [Syntrophobacterales bacterium]